MNADFLNLGILLGFILAVWFLIETYLWIKAFKKEVELSAITAIPFKLRSKGVEGMYYAVEADNYVAYRLWINRVKREAENERRARNGTQ